MRREGKARETAIRVGQMLVTSKINYWVFAFTFFDNYHNSSLGNQPPTHSQSTGSTEWGKQSQDNDRFHSEIVWKPVSDNV